MFLTLLLLMGTPVPPERAAAIVEKAASGTALALEGKSVRYLANTRIAPYGGDRVTERYCEGTVSWRDGKVEARGFVLSSGIAGLDNPKVDIFFKQCGDSLLIAPSAGTTAWRIPTATSRGRLQAANELKPYAPAEVLLLHSFNHQPQDALRKSIREISAPMIDLGGGRYRIEGKTPNDKAKQTFTLRPVGELVWLEEYEVRTLPELNRMQYRVLFDEAGANLPVGIELTTGVRKDITEEWSTQETAKVELIDWDQAGEAILSGCALPDVVALHSNVQRVVEEQP